MRYTDYLNLVKPHNSEFSDYVNKRMHEADLGYDFDKSFGMKDETKAKFGRLFRDMIQLENEVEL